MLTVNTLSKRNADSPGKVVLVYVNGQHYGLGDAVNQSRADVVVYRGELFNGLPQAQQSASDTLATGRRDKVAIGEGDGRRASVKAALEKYLTDNGAKPVCQSHLDPLTDAVIAALS